MVVTDTEPLVVWLSNTTLDQATFNGEFGHTYTFIVTATDRVSNTAQAVASTVTVQKTKYYYLGASRVAMRQSAASGDGEVSYLHADHLGTVSAVTDDNTQVLARTLNLPYGGVRWSSGTSPTDYSFTGQKLDASTGLHYYGARYYASFVGRFVSADTVVPGAGNPQSFNRYAYTLNNPVIYIDPSGHAVACPDDCGSSTPDISYVWPRYNTVPWDELGPVLQQSVINNVFELSPPEDQPRAAELAKKNWVYDAGVTNVAGKIPEDPVMFIPLAGLLRFGIQSVPALIRAVSGPATAACLNDGDCTNEVTTLYRFGNNSSDLTSKLSQVSDPRLQAQIRAELASLPPSDLAVRALYHARGALENSPFISTLLNPASGAASSDPTLRNIVQTAQYLFRFAVPNNLLYFPDAPLSVIETEVLVWADTLIPYLKEIVRNPFVK